MGPGSTSTPVMTRSSSTKKSSNKFRYSWHVTDLDDVLPNGGTPNSQNSTAGTAAVAAVSGGGGGAGGVAVDKDKAIEAAIGELISDFNPSQFASMLEETISKMDKQLESMGAENLEEVEEFDRIMQSVAEGTYHPSHSAMETFPAVEEHQKLMKDQIEIDRKIRLNVQGCTLFETIFECLKNRQVKFAEQLRKDFKISDNQFWWVKIRALAQVGDYEELEKFSKQKKSPIGYEPFARICLEHGNRREASKYIARCSSESKFKLYMEIEDFQKAADTAFQDRSIKELEEVEAKVIRFPDLSDYVKIQKSKLGYR